MNYFKSKRQLHAEIKELRHENRMLSIRNDDLSKEYEYTIENLCRHHKVLLTMLKEIEELRDKIDQRKSDLIELYNTIDMGALLELPGIKPDPITELDYDELLNKVRKNIAGAAEYVRRAYFRIVDDRKAQAAIAKLKKQLAEKQQAQV